MKKLNNIAIDIGHNVNYDTGAVGIRIEDELNMLLERHLFQNYEQQELML